VSYFIFENWFGKNADLYAPNAEKLSKILNIFAQSNYHKRGRIFLS